MDKHIHSWLKSFGIDGKYERHHNFPFGNLVLCGESHEGKSLDSFIQKKTKHPATCKECGFFDERRKKCVSAGYQTQASWPSCRQGKEKTGKRSY
jgi:hypothetical protein